MTQIINQDFGQNFAAYHSDCVEVLRGIPSDSIDFHVFSPPFSSLYTYSNSDRDLGNSKTYHEFAEHYQYVALELYRVLKPGRLVSVHCMNLPTSKERDGYIGLSDFRGDLIRLHQRDGFIYHSEVCIWKDPVTAMQRTKALGLLHKTIRKDSAMSRQGIPDYLVTFRKPGENPDPIPHTLESFPIERWQRYASPIWVTTEGQDDEGFAICTGERDGTQSGTINPSDTLQKESAREERDERHICPLQLSVIERAIKLWTNPGETVLSPFMGIGSEGFVSLKLHRKFIGAELKASYYGQAVRNLQAAEVMAGQLAMFEEEVAA